MFFNFISRFVSLELWENHSFLRRKLFFKKVFQKIISGENDFPPEKSSKLSDFILFFSPRKHSPEIWERFSFQIQSDSLDFIRGWKNSLQI